MEKDVFSAGIFLLTSLKFNFGSDIPSGKFDVHTRIPVGWGGALTIVRISAFKKRWAFFVFPRGLIIGVYRYQL